MGYYINPPNETKEEFLEREASLLSDEDMGFSLFLDNDDALVCLIDNGIFTAAGVVYNVTEFHAFTDPTDPRPKRWYIIKRDKLWDVSDPGLREAFARAEGT